MDFHLRKKTNQERKSRSKTILENNDVLFHLILTIFEFF